MYKEKNVMGYATNNPNGDSGIRTHEYGNQNPVPFTSWIYPFDSGLAGSAPFLIHWYAQRQFRDLDEIIHIQGSFRSFYIHRLFLFRKFSFWSPIRNVQKQPECFLAFYRDICLYTRISIWCIEILHFEQTGFSVNFIRLNHVALIFVYIPVF